MPEIRDRQKVIDALNQGIIDMVRDNSHGFPYYANNQKSQVYIKVQK